MRVSFLFLIMAISCASNPVKVSETTKPLAAKVLTPQVTDHYFPLGSNTNWTHWVVESSTNLIDWESRFDVPLETNADGTINIAPKDHKPIEFFRIAGDFI